MSIATMTERNSDKEHIQTLDSASMSTSVGAHPCRSGCEIVEFSVKGPVAISLDEEEFTSPGCSVLDLQFSSPSQVGELVFRNYYTASLTVLARFDSGNSLQFTQGHTAMSSNAGTSHGKLFVPTNKGTGSGMKLTEHVGGWVVVIPHRVLMPNPHLENGSHDFISVPATESQIEWKGVLTFRLVLRQPSPVWHTFHVEELNVYRDLPRRVPRPVQHSNSVVDPFHCQYDTLLTMVCHQTVAALHWVREPKDSSTVKDNTGPCGYEFFSLPQI
ncbi:nicolin-1-like isoform X2 [Zootermopsis nevadensis]|uniref:nicolin-1-like isoform X2 n=1 Tax=Zootermopsis nevadensis TaxID=136037 RepID=UPI000B8E5007|nr:nicolin-1-like isoform X2 [Zootermopsis nevadensis]